MSYYQPVGQVPPTDPRFGTAAAPPPSSQRRGCGRFFATVTIIALIGVVGFVALIGGYIAIATSLPSPEELQARASSFASTQIYDRQGGLLTEMNDPDHGRRTVVTLDKIAPDLINATIATEDPNFYTHPGVDPVGVARALYYAVRDRDVLSGPGGSTITQQLVKLTYLSSERSLSRKVKEAVLASEITRRYSKQTILQIYLNEINYGSLAYGIEAASETYFAKSARELTLPQAAMLAGLPQAPAYYDPYTRLWESDGVTPGVVKRRQGAVLSLMVRAGYITAEQADAAWKEPLKLTPLKQSYSVKAPHFVGYVRSEVEKVAGPELLAKGGLRIYTTLDPRIQGIAEQEVAAQVTKLAAQNARNGALVAVLPPTGEIVAMVGSADFGNAQISGQINMATSPRQPGSSIKPFTYLAAFEMAAAVDPNSSETHTDRQSALEPPGYWTPGTAILDTRTQFPDGANPPYVPTNYDGREHGLVTVRSALANSYNIPAVKTLQHIGIDRLKNMATRVGISSLTRPDYGLSLTLGGGEVTLLEMTGGFATLANNGRRVPVSGISCVIDASGLLIWRGSAADSVAACKSAKSAARPLATPAPAQQVVNAQYVYLITNILSDLEARRPAFGSSAALLSLPDRPAAAKTGTTNDYRDGWTMGYTPELAVGVWVGNADYKPMQAVAGSLGAAPIWQNVMKRSLEGTPPRPFAVPAGIQTIKVCADSGTLPSEACPAGRNEVFASDRLPLAAKFDLHQRIRLDRTTGQPATQFTPADRVETKDLLLLPPRYKAWAAANGFQQITVQGPQYEFVPELALNSPGDNTEVAGVIPILGRLRLPKPLVWQVEYGVGNSPVGWGVVGDSSRQGDADGRLADWDSSATSLQHQTSEFTLRLAAYDPGNRDYPVAVSAPVHLRVLAPTPTATPSAVSTAIPLPTALPSPTPLPAPATPTVSPTATRTPAPLPTAAATVTPSATRTAGPLPPSATPAVPAPTATASPQPKPGKPVQALIQSPTSGQTVRGVLDVTGIATAPSFATYTLEVAPGDAATASVWQLVAPPQVAQTAPDGGLLSPWHTETLAPGIYTLRLTVYLTDGSSVSTRVSVNVVK
jgi:membrane peptidoglycan carboxypeptidase